MKSISFDNPYLLLVAIPVIAILVVSFLLAIRKESRTKDIVASLVLHIVITILTVTAVAGMTYTSVITKTEVVIVADVSDSAEEKLDKIDERIREIEKTFIGNTDLAVITFAKSYELTTGFGDEFDTVKNSEVTRSDTDIASALNHAAEIFTENSIKRVILITDGMSTAETDDNDVIRSVNNLYSLGVTVDAIFLDTNLGEDAKEVQINSVDYNKSTYRGHVTTAEALITSSYATEATVKLYREGVEYTSRAVKLNQGFNIVTFDISASEDGTFDYAVEVFTRDDATTDNNSVKFTQKVTGDINVLLITSKVADRRRAEALYGTSAKITTYIPSPTKRDLPYTIQELVQYDEILISDVNLLELPNYAEFMKNLDIVVSEYGKTLVTFGNNNIQNKEEAVFAQFENMLPVSYGNNARDAALITFVIDVSKSMNTAGRLNTTREMMKEIINLLKPEDKVCFILFYADNYTELPPTEVGDKTKVFDIIDNNLNPLQGTIIGSAIEKAYIEMKDLNYERKMCIVISDGITFKKESEVDTALASAAGLYANGVIVSTINMWSMDADGVQLMKDMAEAGGGTYYHIEGERDYEGKVKTEFMDDLSESIINKTVDVIVKLEKDDVMKGVTSLPEINGFTTPKVKDNANTVLAVNWKKSELATIEVPLYAYWNYGNGKVASFTTSLTGEWVSEWTTDSTEQLFRNIILWAVPEEKIDYPYTVNISEDGTFRIVELIPAEINLDGVAKLTVTSPLGEAVGYDMIFDGVKYYVTIDASNLGRYDLYLEYSYPGHEPFLADLSINVSYSKEYNRFLAYSNRVLYNAIRGRGDVVGEDEIPTYVYDESMLTTYVVSFTIPFLIAAVALFVIDIIIRKLKWSDIVNLFRKIKRT